MKTHTLTRFTFLLLNVCVLAACGLGFTTFKPGGLKSHQEIVRAVSLGAVELKPTTISASGDTHASATVTVSVATSFDVLPGTIARVELTENSNTDDVVYKVTGGNVGSSGRAWDVTLRGGGEPETIRYTVEVDGNSPAGVVQFRVDLRSVTPPPDSPPPAPMLEKPTAMREKLLLTVRKRQPGGEGRRHDSPILIDVAGDGFSLTGLRDGVDFDFNGDGVIDESDEVFRRLRLWQDKNHNGVSEPGELHTVYGLGLRKIELGYKESRRTDEHGNRFRYRAKVWRLGDYNVARWAWDVFLLAER